jgi:dipeptidyl aminopeptidase/acylaminoacyl peptidase
MKLRRARIGLLHIALLTATGGSFAHAQAQRPMTIVDLINVPSVSDVQLSPDGSRILYVQSRSDWEENTTISHIWRVDADGTDNIQITAGAEGESSPRWAPQGDRIAFIAKRGEDEHAQLYLLNAAGGEGMRLTDHPAAVRSIEWSPDGRWIYYLSDDEKTERRHAPVEIDEDDNVFAFDENWEPRHLWRVNAATGATEKITDGDYTVRRFNLSRDGSTLTISRAPSPLLDDAERSEIWLLDARGGHARRLTENRISESAAALSPDGERLLFVANSNENFEYYYNDKIFLLPSGGGTPEVLLPDFPYEVTDATWSADGRSILFTANTGVREEIFEVDVRRRDVVQLTRGDHVVSSWVYAPQLDRHLFTLSHPRSPGDIYTLAGGRRAAEPQRVTRIYDYIAAQFRLPEVEVVRWNGEDGVEAEGLLFYPLDYEEGRRYPLVVQTHGGPAASDKLSWHSSSDYVPVLTAMGYMVLQPNYRGSTGYGDHFLRNMVGSYFDQAHLDVMAGVDYLIGRGLVDGERMAKMGWSAGGHMTNKIITHTDRFRAASSGAGAVNWISMYGQSDTRVYRTPWFGGTPWEEDAPIEAYLAASPLFEMHRVTTPTLVLVGENDLRVPMPQSVELYRALKSNRVPTHLYVAEGQGHGWRELQQRLFKANVELDWFERWVRDREYTWEASPVQVEDGRSTEG